MHNYELISNHISGDQIRIVYGPVSSWRLGSSLGIDPICRDPKVCTYNCIYCQLGRRGIVTDRKSQFVRTEELVEELKTMKKKEIDVVTFSGTGEPMLASNLKEMAEAIKERYDIPLAILTNSSLFSNGRLETLESFDIVIAKLDAATEKTFRRVNRPHGSIEFEKVLEGIFNVSDQFSGSFRLQIMLVEANLQEAGQLADLCREIGPEIVYLNTPLRPCAVSPLKKSDIDSIRNDFREHTVESIF